MFNIACDIVVNSNILQSNNGDLKSITLNKYGVSMNKTPTGDDGYKYTVEEVYEMYESKIKKGNAVSSMPSNNSSNCGGGEGDIKSKNGCSWDYHGKWKQGEDGEFDEDLAKEKAVWESRLKNAVEIRKAATSRGTVPLLAKRTISKLMEAQTDWREILSSFIQEEIVDYSFYPPDKRYGDRPFFLPDFNDSEVVVKNVLFMVDTSGSMSDSLVTLAYSEIKGAIDQFDEKLNGLLGFFDSEVVPPVPFCDEKSLLEIKILGGGGTDFEVIFKYVRDNMQDVLPSIIIILTDGYAPFPSEA